MNERILHAVGGAFFGGLLGLSITWGWMISFSWGIIAGGAGMGAVLAFLGGEPFLEWLKEVW